MNALRRPVATMVTMLVAAVGAAVLAAPAPQQPLLARFAPETGAYAPGYAYGGPAVPAPAAAVQVGAAVVGKAAALYADAPPAAVGYAPSVVYKPDLSAYAAASFPMVEQLRRFNPGFRSVHTVVPKVTAVEPSVTVQKTYVDVPVVHHVHHPSAYYDYQLLIDGK